MKKKFLALMRHIQQNMSKCRMRGMKLEKMINEMKRTYSVRHYQMISNDFMLINIPYELGILWYSDGRGRMSISNIGYYYGLFNRGEISENEIMKMLTDLNDALAQEFALIIKGKSKERRQGI